MKIATLLTQFLYQHKHLDIPGIGRFSIPDGTTVPDITDKIFPDFLKTIQFSQSNSARANDELIDYIRAKTGKIKPLAESDLESYVADCKGMLNIGKPLYLEGIGTLQKNKDGRFEFTHGQAPSERIEAPHAERVTDGPREKKPLYNTEYTSQNSQTNTLRRVLMLAGIVFGVGVIVWGGYLLYSKKTTSPSTEVSEPVQMATPDASQQNSSDTTHINKIDSNKIDNPVTSTAVTPPGTYKFICEKTLTKQRALNRFEKLKEVSNKFKMETKDSIHFNIYIVLESIPADTTRKKDSLKLWYWGARDRAITIEK